MPTWQIHESVSALGTRHESDPRSPVAILPLVPDSVGVPISVPRPVDVSSGAQPLCNGSIMGLPSWKSVPGLFACIGRLSGSLARCFSIRGTRLTHLGLALCIGSLVLLVPFRPCSLLRPIERCPALQGPSRSLGP